MKNFKRSLALVLALIMIIGTFASVSAFSSTNAWYADAAYGLQSWGVITSEDVESAMAGKIIDRKTFTLWVAKVLSQDVDDQIWDTQTETRYEDVDYSEGSDDNSSAIAYATANGIVRGYTEGPDHYIFGPDDSLKLGQAATIIIRLLDRFGYTGIVQSTYIKLAENYQENFDSTEYAAYMYVAQNPIGVIDNTYKANCTAFADEAELTYGEAAYLLWNAAVNCKTSVEYDKDFDNDPTTDGKAGTIGERLDDTTANISRTYYGIVTKVTTNGTDEVAGLTISLQVSSDKFVTLDLTQPEVKALVVDANKKKTDNVGNINSDGLYVSVRDFTVGTLVKVSYNGNAANDSPNGTLPYNKDKFISITKTNSVIVDSFLVYKYGWCGKNGGYKYNHLYNELILNGTQRLNKTPVLPAYYTSDLAIEKATSERNKQTIYTITFKDVTYILGGATSDTNDTLLIASNVKPTSSDKVIVIYDDTGKMMTVGQIKGVYDSIVNTAEGQMKFTFTDTDGDGDYDILTQNKATVKFDHSNATKINSDDRKGNSTFIIFNKNILRDGETYTDEKYVNVPEGTVAFKYTGNASTGLTALLMNNASSASTTPFYKQVELLGADGSKFTTITGMVTNVETIGGIEDYYRVVIKDAEGNETTTIIPAYNKLFDTNGTAKVLNRTFNYYVGGDSSSLTINTHGWYSYLIDAYKTQYANQGGANYFPATEKNKPTSLLWKTVTVAVDNTNNVVAISGLDLSTSDSVTNGFVTKVEETDDGNVFNLTLATKTGTSTVKVNASVGSAHDWTTIPMLNRLFAKGLLSDTEAFVSGAGYVAATSNILYVEVKNDGGNNYIVKDADANANYGWISGNVIAGDITDRIFDAQKTYGSEYTNQTSPKVPTVATPEVTNYYNAYSASGYTWKVVVKTTDKDGNPTSYAYEKTPTEVKRTQYSQVSKLVVDITKSYTLQQILDAGSPATGNTKIFVPFTVYSTKSGEEIVNPTYSQVYAYQTHKYYTTDTNGNPVLDTTKGYGLFYKDDGSFSSDENVRYFVDDNNYAYTIANYKGLVYKTNADGTYVVATDSAEIELTEDVTTDALAGRLTDLTLPYIKSALPSNTEYKAHNRTDAADPTTGYKYVPGWYRFQVADKEAFDVTKDTKVIIITPSEDSEKTTEYVDYTYAETTIGALIASNDELAVLSYVAYKDSAKGYVTCITVFGGIATAGKNSEIVTPPEDPDIEIDDTKAIVYLPADSITNAFVEMGNDVYYVTSSMQAINLSGEKVGQLNYYYSSWNYGDHIHNAANTYNVEIPAGHFYLIDTTKNNAILADLGAVWKSTGTIDRANILANQSFTYKWTDGSWKSINKNYTWGMDNKVYTISDMNSEFKDSANINSTIKKYLASGTELGKFGTMTITDVTPESIIATVDGATNQNIANLKFKFVYFDYAGNGLYEAEAQTVSKDMPTSGLDIIYKAEGYTVDEFNKYFREVWFQTWYGKTPDVQKQSKDALDQMTPAAYYDSAVAELNNAITSGASLDQIEAAQAKVEKATELLAEFEAKYAAAQNDIFWSSDIVNTKLYQYKVAQVTSGNTNVKYPTFTYYYDYATSTYTVFVTSFENN